LGFIGLIVMSILAPLAAVLIQLAISRSREYQADATGAGFIGDPGALANALEKLGNATKRLPMQAKPNTAHMFIVNPLSGGGLASLFSTHPPLGERISRLRGRKGLGTGPTTGGHSRDAKRRAENAWRQLSGGN
jgi:heat shock protein HtpX